MFADLPREGLSLGDVLLPEAFGAMPKNFVEENRGGAAGEERGARIGFDQRRGRQRFQLLAQNLSFGKHCLVVRRVGWVGPVKIKVAVDVHPIGRLALNEQFQPVMNLAELQARPFAVGLILVLPKRAESDDGI